MFQRLSVRGIQPREIQERQVVVLLRDRGEILV
jgi:hypothetical protein